MHMHVHMYVHVPVHVRVRVHVHVRVISRLRLFQREPRTDQSQIGRQVAWAQQRLRCESSAEAPGQCTLELLLSA